MSPYRAEKLLVHLACADWSNLDGEFHPTYEEIAEKARVTKPGAIGIVQSMIEEGEIELLAHGRGRGNRNQYRFPDNYRLAVQELMQKWAAKRQEKSKRGLSIKPAQRVNEGDPFDGQMVNGGDLLKPEKVNEDDEKGKRGMTHIRNNRHVPSAGEAPPLAHPFDNFSDPETEMALAVASVMGYSSLPEGRYADPIKAAAREFLTAQISPGWVVEFEREWYSRKIAQGKRYALTLKILLEDFPGWARSRRINDTAGSATVRAKAQFCGQCNAGWLLPAPGETGAQRCPCVEAQA